MCIKNAHKVDWDIKYAYKVLGASCKGLVTTTFAMSVKEIDEWQYPSNERLYPYPDFNNWRVPPENYFDKRKHKNKINVFLDREIAILYSNKLWKQSVHFFGAPTEVWEVEIDYATLIVGDDSCYKATTALVDRMRLIECIYPKEKIRTVMKKEINNENTFTEDIETIPIEKKICALIEQG